MAAGSNYRHVLKGRNNKNNISMTGRTETYSNYSLMNPDQVLDGFPLDSNVDPGTGNHPSDYFMSYIYRGKQHVAPMSKSGDGPRVDGYRQKMMEYKGLPGTMAFPSGYGHGDRETSYSLYDNYKYRGVRSSGLKSSTLGHATRATSTINSFGSFGPNIRKGVNKGAMPASYGHTTPTDYDNSYGLNKPNEWRGAPSSSALNVKK